MKKSGLARAFIHAPSRALLHGLEPDDERWLMAWTTQTGRASALQELLGDGWQPYAVGQVGAMSHYYLRKRVRIGDLLGQYDAFVARWAARRIDVMPDE